MMHVELTPSPGAVHAAAVRAMQRAPAPLQRVEDVPARPPTQSIEAHSPEPSSEGSSTKQRASTPTVEASESDHVRAGGATSIAHAPPSARLAPASVYPEEARWERRAGRVVLNFHIRLDGTVGDAQVFDSSGHADIDHAAIAALREWKFDAPAVVPGARYGYAFRFDLK
jgi:protein TonB